MLFVAAAPFTIDFAAFDARAAALFAVIGAFFPALVTLYTFRSNEELGPTVTGAVSGTAPLFALAGAALVLGERVPAAAAIAALGVGVGVALLSWDPRGIRRRFAGRALAWPFAGALVRGFAQVGAKAGLALWPNPFAAGLIAYLVSSATVVGADRLRSGARARLTAAGLGWFGVTGVLNGGAVLLLYSGMCQRLAQRRVARVHHAPDRFLPHGGEPAGRARSRGAADVALDVQQLLAQRLAAWPAGARLRATSLTRSFSERAKAPPGRGSTRTSGTS